MGKDSLTLALIQSKILWEDRDGNLEAFNEKIGRISGSVDLIILPETFNTGFTQNVEKVAEEVSGPTMQWMHSTASQTFSIITGSLIIKEEKNYYNRLIWMRPDGTFDYYDKRHLFQMEGEESNLTAGNTRKIIEEEDWAICPLICYDLRFPVWCRNDLGYDVLLFVANWPKARRQVWRSLLIARAIENQCYVIAVNRLGADANNIEYSGDSMVVDPKGKMMNYAIDNQECIVRATIDMLELKSFRQKFPVLDEIDDFTLNI